jgi:TRAP-type C4-dicarboxylate transport system permease small subunit
MKSVSVEKLSLPTAIACGTLFVVLLFTVIWGVLTRYLFGDQARWTEELARFLLVWVSFLGAALAYARRQHLGIDLLVNRFDPWTRRIAECIVHALVALFAFVVMGFGGFELVVERFNSGQLLPSLGVSKAWQYLVVPISGLMIGLLALIHLVETARGREVAGTEVGEGAP